MDRRYLSNRIHFVSIDGFSSNSLPVHTGVQNRRSWGLYSLYTNDIPNVATFSSSYLFVDNIKFIKSISSFSGRLERQEDSDSFNKMVQ